jgi:hypothetical protein
MSFTGDSCSWRCAGHSLPPPAGQAPLLAGLSRAWSRNIRAGAMALVFLRAGLGLNVSTIKAYGLSFVSFTTLPSLLESLACALVARALFGMPFLLAWSMSWMTSAVGPGALTSGCASVKERGYSPRAPNFLQTCACFDDAVCIVGFNIALHSFLAGSDITSSNQWDYKTVLLALTAGVAGGACAALCLSCTAVWCTPARRSAVLVIACAMLMCVALPCQCRVRFALTQCPACRVNAQVCCVELGPDWRGRDCQLVHGAVHAPRVALRLAVPAAERRAPR